MAGHRCVKYVNSRPPVRGIVSVQCQVLSPLVRARRPVPARPREVARLGEGRRARRLAGSEGGRGKGGWQRKGGQLRMRHAMAADARRAAAAMPFTRSIAAGCPPRPSPWVACDVSGSMSGVTWPVASTAWIPARATASLPAAPHRHRHLRARRPSGHLPPGRPRPGRRVQRGWQVRGLHPRRQRTERHARPRPPRLHPHPGDRLRRPVQGHPAHRRAEAHHPPRRLALPGHLDRPQRHREHDDGRGWSSSPTPPPPARRLPARSPPAPALPDRRDARRPAPPPGTGASRRGKATRTRSRHRDKRSEKEKTAGAEKSQHPSPKAGIRFGCFPGNRRPGHWREPPC